MSGVPPRRSSAGVDVRDHALRTMSRVLGASRAQALTALVLRESGLELSTPDDLLAFAREIEKLPGFEAAVGAMLSLDAVMFGAKGAAA